MRYAFIQNHQAQWPFAVQRDVLAVSGSGHYAWGRRGPSEPAQRCAELTERIREVHAASRHSISSLKLGVQRFAAAVRGHWGIENALHWRLGVTFREDNGRLRNRHAANNLAWLNRFAISLLKQQTDKESVAMRRRMAGWNVDYLAQVVGLLRR